MTDHSPGGAPDGVPKAAKAGKKEKAFVVVAAGYRAGLFWKYGEKYNIKFVYIIPYWIHIFDAKNNSLYKLCSEMTNALENHGKNNKWCDCILAPKNVDELIKIIDEKYIPVVVTPGADAGVELADKLAYHYKVEGANDPRTTQNRLDKYNVNVCLEKAGIRAIKTFKINRPGELDKIVDKVSFPCFFKPAHGVASMEAKKITGLQELKDAVDVFFSKPGNDLFNGILIQELMVGEEYIVNFAAVAGTYYFDSLFVYLKKFDNKGINKYLSCDYIADYKSYKNLIDYSIEVMNAIGFKSGASHIELMVDKDGPVLIEINNRIMGAHFFIEENTYVTKMSHSEFLISKLLKTRPETIDKTLSKYTSIVHLISDKTGTVKKSSILEFCKKLESFVKVLDNQVIAGKEIPEYRDMMDTVCWVELANDDKKQLLKDKVALLSAMEKDELWELQ
jgi:biotin carboxylase